MVNVYQAELNVIHYKKNLTPSERLITIYITIYILDSYKTGEQYNLTNRTIGKMSLGMDNDKEISSKVSHIISRMKAKNIIELVYNTNIDSNGKATKGKREEIKFSNEIK